MTCIDQRLRSIFAVVLALAGLMALVSPRTWAYDGRSTLAAESAATGYGLTSWNVGAIYQGVNNINVLSGQPLGGWGARAQSILSGVGGTAFAAAGVAAPIVSAGTPIFGAESAGGTGIAYRAINPAYADATEASGQFYQSGAAGRLGNDGIYANSTVEGATAEFQFHNPGVTPTVFKVQYPITPTLNINPPSGYFSSPLPFTGDANILTAPSLRAPGTTNLLIRQGAAPAGITQ